MKKIFSIIVASVIICALSVAAQTPDNSDNRRQLIKELRDYKQNYLTRALQLSREQQQKFFPVYFEMEEKTGTLNNETRDLEKKVADDLDNASDLELDKTTEALFELKIKEGEIEKEYLEQFRAILSKKQLFQLKGVERNFSRDLLQQQNRLRNRAKN